MYLDREPDDSMTGARGHFSFRGRAGNNDPFRIPAA